VIVNFDDVGLRTEIAQSAFLQSNHRVALPVPGDGDDFLIVNRLVDYYRGVAISNISSR
jgi:hypothetical protein